MKWKNVSNDITCRKLDSSSRATLTRSSNYGRYKPMTSNQHRHVKLHKFSKIHILGNKFFEKIHKWASAP